MPNKKPLKEGIGGRDSFVGGGIQREKVGAKIKGK